MATRAGLSPKKRGVQRRGCPLSSSKRVATSRRETSSLLKKRKKLDSKVAWSAGATERAEKRRRRLRLAADHRRRRWRHCLLSFSPDRAESVPWQQQRSPENVVDCQLEEHERSAGTQGRRPRERSSIADGLRAAVVADQSSTQEKTLARSLALAVGVGSSRRPSSEMRARALSRACAKKKHQTYLRTMAPKLCFVFLFEGKESKREVKKWSPRVFFVFFSIDPPSLSSTSSSLSQNKKIIKAAAPPAPRAPSQPSPPPPSLPPSLSPPPPAPAHAPFPHG